MKIKHLVDIRRSPTLTLLLICFVAVFNVTFGDEDEHYSYGLDVSWPMHSSSLAWGHRQEVFNDFIEGCVEYYKDEGHLCRSTERDRLEMSKRQPAAMTNYTDIGFKKIKAPKDLMDMLYDFWEKNKDNEKTENWFTGNIYTNHWTSPTTMVSVEDPDHEGAGPILKQRIWDAARDSLEEWTGHALKESSLYGIRVYKENSILATHVDRIPLISSCIINVAQDVEEDWPIEVIGHDGKAHNITMEPGDMVLYESHSVLHGRPFALKGKFYANVFIHFEPLEPYAEQQEGSPVETTGHPYDLPLYIQEGSVEAKSWRKNNPDFRRSKEHSDYYNVKKLDTILNEDANRTTAHRAAAEGNLRLIEKHSDEFIHKQDSNGWGPIHEAVRAGHTEIVKYLIGRGVDKNVGTNRGLGFSPLKLARSYLGEEHGLVKYLIDIGSASFGPDL